MGLQFRLLFGNGGLSCHGRVSACPERHVDQSDEDPNLDEPADHPGERFTGGHAEDADRHAIASSKLLLAAVNATVVVRV